MLRGCRETAARLERYAGGRWRGLGGKSLRRSNLTSKHGNKNFYKGRGAPSTGRVLKNQRFLADPKKIERLRFKVPSLEGFELKPYVEAGTPPIKWNE